MEEFLVSMHITLPADLPTEIHDDLYAREGRRARDLGRLGFIKRIWRVPGTTWNWMLWEAENASHLHDMVSSFPLFSYCAVCEVFPLARNINDPGLRGVAYRSATANSRSIHLPELYEKGS